MPSLWAWNNVDVTTDFSQLSVDEIAQHYATDKAQWLRTNMVLSLDGNYAGPTGSSRDISHPIDLDILLLIRALSDAVLVGARTALGEKYRINENAQRFASFAKPAPRLVVVSNSLELPLTAPMFESVHRPLVITKSSTEHHWNERIESISDHADIHVIETDAIDGGQIKEVLQSHDLNHVVCEGGPALLNTLFTANVVDEMCLTTSPTILGCSPQTAALGQQHRSFHYTQLTQAHDFTFARLARML